MEENEQNQNQNPSVEYKEEKDDEEYFTNVFSQIGKFEKNKRYAQLQQGLNSLRQNVKLMEEFSSKDKLSNKGKFFSKRISLLNLDKDNDIKKNSPRRMNSIFIRKRIPAINNNMDSNSMSIPQLGENNINNDIFSNINKKIGRKKVPNNRINNLSLQKYRINLNNIKNKLIYKTEVNNYNELINGQKLPNIYLSSDKVNDSNLGSKNTNSTSRLPIIQENNKSGGKKKIYLLTDNNTENISVNESLNNKVFSYKKIPLIRKNLKDNFVVQKFPTILNSRRGGNSTLNHKIIPQHTDKIVRKMKEKNVKIKNRINNKLNEQDLIDWEMKSRFKLAQWKYGIAEIQKYFVDLQAYGKPEEEELLKRKTFYDFVEDLIDEIKKGREEKEIKSIEDKYINNNENNKFGMNKKKDKKDQENNDLNAFDNTTNKQIEINEILEKIKLRKKKEKQKRLIVDNILFKSDMRRKAINDSSPKIDYKKKILNKSQEDENENSKNSIEKDDKNE